MLYTPHFLTGAAILKAVPNPLVGLPLAFASHILLDLLPHHDFDITPGFTLKDLKYMEKRRKYLLFFSVGLDFIFLLISFLWVLLIRGPLAISARSPLENNYLMLAGGIIAISPDVIDQTAVALDYKLPAWQNRFQWKVAAKYGFITYPIVSIIALYFLVI